MNDSYNTDGMYNMPVINTNCLESIKMAIAFDVRDWGEDRRSAWIYGIVFGLEEELEEVKTKFRWTDEDVERLNRYHDEWDRLLNKQTRWIPTSEKLPEIGQDILLSLRSLDTEIGFRANNEPYFYCDGEYIEPQDVLAWQPLPQLYKEGE